MAKLTSVRRRCVASGLVFLFAACGAPPSEPAAEEVLSTELSGQAAKWNPLGENLNLAPADFVSKLSLASAPRSLPVLAFSETDSVTQEEKTPVASWDGSSWQALGQPLAEGGPALAIDSQKRIFVCTGNGGPFVKRWNGSRYVALGGNIGEESGYKGLRYQVGSCGGIVLDSCDAPIVAWSADVGAKANLVYAARWNRILEKWDALGEGSIGGRATEAHLGIDSQDHPYVATYTPGGSYGGGATTRVWRWSGTSWVQLGSDMPDTSSPALGVYESAAYLALHDNASDALNVMRWQTSWQSLPSPGTGDLPVLDFSRSGKPVLAYVKAATETALKVDYFVSGAWVSVGNGAAAETAGIVELLDLTVDSTGRPNLGWSEMDPNANRTSIFVKRFGVALP